MLPIVLKIGSLDVDEKKNKLEQRSESPRSEDHEAQMGSDC